jgi:hypothetical protein
MKHRADRSWRAGGLSFAGLIVVALSILAGSGCGGSAPSQPATGGGQGSGGGPPFQPRPFPGDFFIRLSPQAGNGYAAAAAYDPTLKEVFVSDPISNAVEVYSTVDAHMVGEIDVPGPAGLSFSPDYSKLVVGSITPFAYVADPVALHVTGQIEVPISYLSITQFGATLMPVMPYAMADGTIVLGMGTEPSSTSTSYPIVEHLVRYDPINGNFTLEDPGGGGIGLAIPARSMDGKFLLVEGLGNSTLNLFLYSTASQGYIATSTPLPNEGIYLAANANGSQFASTQEVLGTATFTSQVNFWGPNLQAENQYTSLEAPTGNLVYSRDGQSLYGLTPNGIFLAALNTQTAAPIGYMGVRVGASETFSEIFDVDETNHLFGAVLFGGAMIVNASQLSAYPPAALPLFTTPATEGSLTVGSVSGGGQDSFSPAAAGPGGSDGIDSTMEAYFGSVPSPLDVVTQSSSGSSVYNSLTATVPAASTPGPVSVVLTDASNDAVFLPDDFTYGPHLLRVGPNAVSAKGGDPVEVSAYGLSGQMTFGATRVEISTGVFDSFPSFYYPEQSVTLTAPAGNPGWADISVSNGFGSDTLKHGLQYLSAEALVKGAPNDFVVYDSARDRFYLTGSGNTVAVFDPQTQTFLPPLQSATVSSSATLFGEALTPDSSKLLVSDPDDHVVVVFDLVSGTSAAVNILLPSDSVIAISEPMPIEAAANNRAFVSITPCITNPVREINLSDMSVQGRPDAASSCATYIPYPEFGGASADGSTIIFAGNSGLEPPGPEYVWSYNATTDSFSGPLQIGDTPWVGGQASADGDGQVIALSQGTLDQRLLPLVPFEVGGVDSRLNETGSLLYSVSSSVVISDTHNGRPLLTIGLPNNTGIGPTISPYRPLAIDPTGKKILVATPTGASYFELSVIPLAVGTVSPTQGPTGSIIQIRGSGFVSGTIVQIGRQNAICTETDTETLFCTVPNLPLGSVSMNLANPDGQTYAFENAFSVQ